MIEIGKALPNSTDPTVTTGAAEMLAFKALSFFRRDHAEQRPGDQPSLAVSNIRVAPWAACGGTPDAPRAAASQFEIADACTIWSRPWSIGADLTPSKCRSLHRRERGRHQQLIDDVADDLAVLLGLGARRDPVRVALECRPFLLAVGERFPCQQIGQFLIGFADQRSEETGLLDAVLLPQFQRDGLEALQERRQPARQATIDAGFVNHGLPPFSCAGVIAGGRGAVLRG